MLTQPCPCHPSIARNCDRASRVGPSYQEFRAGQVRSEHTAPHGTSAVTRHIKKHAAAPSPSDGSARGKTDHTCRGMQIQSGPGPLHMQKLVRQGLSHASHRLQEVQRLEPAVRNPSVVVSPQLKITTIV